MITKDILEKAKQTNEYKDFENYVSEIDVFRNKYQPMTDVQGNKFRHLSGLAAMAQKYGPVSANLWGVGKELEDYFIKHKSGKDSLGDLRNNLFGSIIGVKEKYEPRLNLYNKIFQDYVNDYRPH